MLLQRCHLHPPRTSCCSLHGRHRRPRSSPSVAFPTGTGRGGVAAAPRHPPLLPGATSADAGPAGGASVPSRTQRIMESISSREEVGGAGGAYSYNALKRLDNLLSNICQTTSDLKGNFDVVFCFPGSSGHLYSDDNEVHTFDVLVCGGTLGIFVAASLACEGLRVGIVEKNLLKGREQEWNISSRELMELLEVGILSEEEIDQVTAVEFNPNRCGFEGKGEIWVEDILNLGVSPAKLLEVMKERFSSLGGIIFEGIGISKICIYDDTSILHLSDGKVLSSKLVIDSMGNFSPVVKQIRSGRKPDGMCLVVGSCSRGFKENTTSDVIFSSSSVRMVRGSKLQYFWEAFPAGSGSTDRTTYMFTYVDAQPGCPKLEDLLEDYWDLMPEYQVFIQRSFANVTKIHLILFFFPVLGFIIFNELKAGLSLHP